MSGFVVSKTGRNFPGIWFRSALITVGTGPLIMLNHTSSIAEQEIFPLIATIGAGSLSQFLIVAVQAAIPQKDMATATSGFMFPRVLGGIVGLVIDDAIIASVVPSRKLAAIPNIASLGLGDNVITPNDSIGVVNSIPDITRVTLRDAMLHGAALMVRLFSWEYSVDRKTAYGGDIGNGGIASETR